MTRVQARLNPEEQELLSRLVRQLGWSPSRIVREGLRLVAATRLPGGARRIIGLGQFESGVHDLATNKRHMEGFGR